MNIFNREISIDLMKFLAVFLIINSHMDALYTQYSQLATGGSIGDALFLFCSGYALLLGKEQKFDLWYKRRINRIYPSVIICAIMGCLFSGKDNITLLKLGGGEFVLAIMVYYILLYLIKKYALAHLSLIFGCLILISILVYIFFFPYKYETGEKGMYGITTLYRWIPYFGFMLLGSWCGLHRAKIKSNLWQDILYFCISLIMFYGIQYFATMNKTIASWQIITLAPLAGIIYYCYKICKATFWNNVIKNRKIYISIIFISGISLESYLIQYSVFTTSMNDIFPFNLLIMVIIVISASYLCKILSTWLSQTFSSEEYDYCKIIKYW